MGNERRSARQLCFFSGRRRTEPKAKASVSPRAKAEVKAERNCEYCSGGREPLARSARQLCFFSGRREGVEAAGDLFIRIVIDTLVILILNSGK